MRRSCGSCRAFYPCKTCEEWERGAEPRMGECRRHPPKPNPSTSLGDWPTVESGDWCMEHVFGHYDEWGYE